VVGSTYPNDCKTFKKGVGMNKRRMPRIVLITMLGILLITCRVFSGEGDTRPDTEHPGKHPGYKHHGGQHRFKDAETWAKRFEGPERDAWQKPDAVIKALDLKQGTIVADIGSATGYFPVRFARALPKGRVYGIDIEKSMVDYLNERAGREDLPNLSSILGKLDDPKLPEPVDMVFICNTYHHLEDRQVYFEKLKKNLRAGARLVIVDFIKGKLPVGPPDQMKLAPDELISELSAVEYRLVQKLEIIPYQYVLIFQLIK
jgi:SAM-dependent methyltransferase